MADDILIRADHVGKKFCRNLKRSLWYGVQDSVTDVFGVRAADTLRPHEFWAVNDISFELKRGECIGLIGHNGAGKTTLLKMLSGLIKPDHGRIEINGKLGALIALGAGFNPVLTGRENVYVNGSVLGLTKREIDAKYDEIIDFADIGEFINAPVQSYSSGMQVRLGFAIAVAVKPDVLLLDEVLAVGDANFQAKCFNTLARFRADGTSFVLVSHNNHMISRYCQSTLYMRGGKPIFNGDVETGLAMLSDEMAAKGSKGEADGPDWSTARGSGRVRLTNGEFLDADGHPIEVAEVGQPLTLALHYERVDPNVRAVQLDISVRQDDHNVFQGDNLAARQPLELTADRGVLLVKFQYFPWNSEKLDLFIALLDPTTTETLDWKRNMKLRLNRRVRNNGSVFMPVEWVSVGERAAADGVFAQTAN